MSFARNAESLDLFAAPFTARLTSIQAGTGAQAGLWLYGFTEQIFDPATGIPQDADAGRTDNLSTAATTYALERNNSQLTVPGITPAGYTNPGPYVKLQLLGSVDNGAATSSGPVYVFDATAGTEASAQISLTSTTSQSITLAGGGTATVFPAQLWTLVSGTWTAGAACWYLGLNGEEPPYNVRLFVRQTATEASSGKAVYSKELLTGICQVTSTTPQNINVFGGGGSLSVYPAQMRVINTSASWANCNLPVWFYGANGETPTLNKQYLVMIVATDTNNKPVVSTNIPTTPSDTDVSQLSYTCTGGTFSTSLLPSTTTPLTQYDITPFTGGSSTNQISVNPFGSSDLSWIVQFVNVTAGSDKLTFTHSGIGVGGIYLPPLWQTNGLPLAKGDSATFWYSASAQLWYLVATTAMYQESPEYNNSATTTLINSSLTNSAAYQDVCSFTVSGQDGSGNPCIAAWIRAEISVLISTSAAVTSVPSPVLAKIVDGGGVTVAGPLTVAYVFTAGDNDQGSVTLMALISPWGYGTGNETFKLQAWFPGYQTTPGIATATIQSGSGNTGITDMRAAIEYFVQLP